MAEKEAAMAERERSLKHINEEVYNLRKFMAELTIDRLHLLSLLSLLSLLCFRS
jgi:hypothetical protein